MRRGLVHVGAWVLACGAAVTLSWFGVRVVVSDTVYDGSPTLPLTGGFSAPPSARAGVEPETDSTRRPGPLPGTGSSAPAAAPSVGPSDASGSRAADGTGREDGTPDPDDGSPGRSGGSGGSGGSGDGQRPYEASGTVESHDLRGGRVVFDLRPDSATLVSASPNGGWGMRVWRESRWIRVTFTRGDEASSAHCVWNGSPPRVVIDEHGA